MEPSYAKSRKVALITGGARGIGQAIACALARDGYDIVVNYIDITQEETSRLTDEADSHGISMIFIQADVTDQAAIDTMIQTVTQQYGRIDVLVNNAGILAKQPFIELTEENFDAHIATNLKSVAMVARKALPLLEQAEKAKIILISSASAFGYSKESQLFSYAVSKAGLIGMTKGLATELGPKILVNCIAPAYIATDMLLAKASPEANEARKSRTVLGRFGRPEEIGGLVSYLVSTDAEYITGQVFHINGGRYFGS